MHKKPDLKGKCEFCRVFWGAAEGPQGGCFGHRGPLLNPSSGLYGPGQNSAGKPWGMGKTGWFGPKVKS